MLRWRVLVLSTGEIDLAGFMSGGGKRSRAGQEVRLASLPADAGRNLGAFENLHGLSDSNALAKALDVAFGENYGTVGRAFVAEVSAHSEECTKRLQAAIVSLWDRLPNQASGQVRRVASRFAVTGEALEIATDFGLTGWKNGDGTRAILQCFDSWLDRYGLGNREDEQIMAQAEAWFGAHSYGRFIDWRDASSNCLPNVHDAAGYRRNSSGENTWLVFPHVFSDEIAQGFDKVAAADILAKAGMLQKSGDGKATTPHRTPDVLSLRRFYKFTSSSRSLPDEQG
jgi:putative DNA primase/helicase